MLPGMTTDLAGTLPLSMRVSDPLTSRIGEDPVKVTPAPRTTPCSRCTPSTTIQREPTKQSSSTMTGLACTGSNTPPIPTPPLRCTLRPICAQEPTVAQVSTMVPDPTRAPTLMNEGITMQSFSTKALYRITAGGTTRIPEAAKEVLIGTLS